MFDIGLGEFALLGVLALLVFGPERLPSVAASAGSWVAKLRESLTAAKSSLSDSIEVDGLAKDMQAIAELHPRRIVKSLAEPTEAAAPKPKPSGGIDADAT